MLQRKKISLENELKKAEKVEETVARAQLITSNLFLFNSPGIKSATVQDWENDGVEVELVLDPKYDSASAEADALFQQARKLKRGSKVIRDLLVDTSSAYTTLQDIKDDFSSAAKANDDIDENILRLLQDRLLRTSRMTSFEAPSDDGADNQPKQSSYGRKQRIKKPPLGTPASNVRKVISEAGCTIYVGRNRRGNEYLSMSLAKDNDVWMHARGCPGAHVVIEQRRGSGVEVTPQCLQLAANLAVFYSDARSERRSEVTVAKPKHIQKPRNAPLGAVKLRKEDRVLVGIPDNVPEELKQAREESGQLEEYRASDKAKHRKRTRVAAMEQKAKRKRKKKATKPSMS